MPRKAGKPKKTKLSKPIDSVKHKDKRKNIPTRELADFVIKEEQKPYARLYPRDPSLDPQLVWKGKDEQDSQDLSVPTVPIYIQEKIAPEALIENLREEQKKGVQEPQPDLFSDFNGIDFERLVEFYQHDQNWSNRMILGDSLLVMNSLAEKEGLKGKVQMIYIDPPYGIKFGSNWQVSTRKRDVKDGKVDDATRQPEQIKAFRDTWELGIHSYLAYLRDRLVVARELLTETGSVFVQIGDENVHLLRCLLDEVFGSENFHAIINFRSMTPLGQKGIARVYDYILWYAKKYEQMKFRPLFIERPIIDEPEFCYFDSGNGEYKKLKRDEIGLLSTEKLRKIFKRSVLTSSGYTPSCTYKFEYQGRTFSPLSGKSWRTHPDGMKRLVMANRLIVLGKNPYFRQYHSDFPLIQMENSWHDTAAGFSEEKVYVVQTSDRIIQRCMLMTSDPGDLILDPTCGGGTTAYVAEKWGRRWITIDTSRVALALSRTRLMAARYPYYILSDSPEGVIKQAESYSTLPQSTSSEYDIKKGFVYKHVPRITLKSIANNPDITEGITNNDIDIAIGKNGETEILYDQAEEDRKRIRVSGSFTVESLSPHRVLTTEEARPASEKEDGKAAGGGQFETMILDNLRKAGVQNTIKNERLTFDRLESYAGVYLHAEGEYTEGGKSRRAAVCIGPEHGTVGPELVKDAAKEAVKGIGFDLLVVCGFAFDPHVSEEAKQFGKLAVLMARMNPDLAMGDELLKKTGSGNLFMVFGEPDVKMTKQKDGKLVVEIKGVDVYDPTTGQIRSHSTDDIACWFIDTAYNGESFFVRHAYFTGAGDPYNKLERALRSEINEEAWSTLYSTKSRPFDPPDKGKIAIKVINHYGDEVLKVYEV